MTECEVWRPVPGVDGYFVSDLGRVLTHRRLGKRTTRERPERRHLVVPRTDSMGYLAFSTGYSAEGRRSADRRLHAAVAGAFLGPTPQGKVIAFANGIKGDCRLVNLSFMSRAELKARDRRLHLLPLGEKVGGAKLTHAEVRAIRASTERSAALARRYAVTPSNIYLIRRGVNWRHA